MALGDGIARYERSGVAKDPAQMRLDDIRNSYDNLLKGNNPDAVLRYLASTPYSPQELAAAIPGYSAQDFSGAIASARQKYPDMERWDPIQQRGMGTAFGDPGVSSAPSEEQSLRNAWGASQIQGFKGTFEDFKNFKAQQAQEAQAYLGQNPDGAVIGGSAPQYGGRMPQSGLPKWDGQTMPYGNGSSGDWRTMSPNGMPPGDGRTMMSFPPGDGRAMLQSNLPPGEGRTMMRPPIGDGRAMLQSNLPPGDGRTMSRPGIDQTFGKMGGPSSPGSDLYQNVNVNQYNQNPYLQQMGQVLTNRVSDNLNRNIMPSIRNNAIASGGLGGSRQGVIEANALKDANQTISDSLTGAYFQDFTNQMNRNLQQYGQNQGFALGLGNLALGNKNSDQNFYLGNKNSDQNFYTSQRGQDLQQMGLGASLFNMGNQGWLSQGQGLYGLGGMQQMAPWQVINNANAGLGQWSGYGNTTTANQGGGWQGLLGGALAGGQYGRLWGNTGSTYGMQPSIESYYGY